MAVDRRGELVDAGVRLAVAQRFQDVLTSVDTRSITDEAGVTTGSFFHHFRNRAHFAEAVADWFTGCWGSLIEVSLAQVEASHAGAPGVRWAAEDDWDHLAHDELVAGIQHLLLATQAQPISVETSVTGGDVLRAAYGAMREVVVPAYERALQATQREMLPPFTVDDMAVAFTALSEGIQMRGRVEPDTVRRDLYADLITAMVLGLTRPVWARADTEELAQLEQSLGPGAGSTSGDDEERQRIAEAAAPLFTDRAVSEVRMAEVAAAAGVDSTVAYQLFGTVAAVAACGWLRHIPELRALAEAPYTVEAGPTVRIEQVMGRFVELGRANRGALEGFLLEALADAVPSRAARSRFSVTEVLPVVDMLVPHVQELRTRGELRRGVDGRSLATSIVQLVANRVLMVRDESVERTVDDTLGLLLEGALTRRG